MFREDRQPWLSSIRRLANMPGVDPERPSRSLLAGRDLIDGLRCWPLWFIMGWYDIKQRYRRSTLGPFWLTLSMAVLIGSLGILYARLFKMEIDQYLPFLCLGLLIWNLISTMLTEGCAAFIQAERLIKQIRTPLSVHIYRLIWRNLIIFAHNLIVYLGVAVLFGIWPGAKALLFIPGLAVVLLNAIWAALLVAVVCTRFRDVPQIVSTLVQVAFFLTPVIWMPELLKDQAWIVQWNPFFAFVDLMRAPLLGQDPEPFSWIAALIVTAIGGTVTFAVFRRFRSRIAYWL